MYTLPDPLRARLARPLAPVLSTDQVLHYTAGKRIISVGDVVTQTFLDNGITPHVMLVDGVTQRTHATTDALHNLPTDGIHHTTIDNPPATITDALIAALQAALQHDGPTLIQVKGEEDLAALPALMYATAGTIVCYGQPNQGVVAVEVNETTRAEATSLFEQMEVN